MHTDALLYRLFQERPATLFELADFSHSGAGYRLTAIEVKEAAFRLDGILMPLHAAPAHDPALFLENQFQYHEQFYARWLAAIFLFLYLPNLSRDEIKAMLHLPDTDLKQTRFYREVFAEGREEGRSATQRQTALNLLRQTSLGDAAIAAVTGLDTETVTALRREL